MLEAPQTYLTHVVLPTHRELLSTIITHPNNYNQTNIHLKPLNATCKPKTPACDKFLKR